MNGNEHRRGGRAKAVFRAEPDHRYPGAERLVKRPPFAEHHPLWFVALLELVVTLVYLLVGTAAHFARLSAIP